MEFSLPRVIRKVVRKAIVLPHVPTWHQSFPQHHTVDGGDGPTVPSQPLDRVKHTCPVSAAVGVDRRSSEDPTEATGVLLCNGDYFKK